MTVVIGSSLAFFRFGWWSLAIFVPIALVPVFETGLTAALPVFLSPAVFGITGGYCFRTGRGLDFFLTVSALVFTVLFTADYLFLKNVKGYDMVKQSMDEMVTALENSKSGIDQLAIQYKTPKEDVEKLKSDLNTMIGTLKDTKWIQLARNIIPFSAFLFSVAVVSVSFLLMMRFALKNAAASVKPLQYFRLNDYFIFALIAGIAGLLLLKQETHPVLFAVSLNAALITAVLYAIQALGIVKHLFIRKGIPVFILPILVLTAALISPASLMFLLILFTGLGSLDLWADFRKLNPDTMKNKE